MCIAVLPRVARIWKYGGCIGGLSCSLYLVLKSRSVCPLYALLQSGHESLKARFHGDSLRAGKSRWQVGYRVSLYCHWGRKSG
jgi:hypothetical protein